MKKITLLPLIIFSLMTISSEVLAKKREERIIPENQSLKVKVVNLIGGNYHSEEKLERILLEQLSKGWEYDYNIDISREGYNTKLLVFKRITIKK